MKTLFVTYNRLGDAVLSSGLLTHLACEPAARITVACGPVAAPLFGHAPGVERVFAMAKRRAAGHWLGLWRACAGRRWDRVVDLRGSALAWLLLARRRYVARPSSEARHRVVDLGAVLGLEPPPAPRLWPAPEHEARAASLLPRQGPLLAVGPTANWGGKQWPAERFAALAQRLTGPQGPLPDAAVAVLAAPQEASAAAPVLAAVPEARRIDLTGGEHLLTLAACLARADLYVGNDSGLMHMAAAAGAPTLGLFGPSREELYAPWGPRAAAVRTERSYAEIRNDPAYDWRKADCWMLDLSVDKAEAAAVALLERLSRVPAA